MKARKQPKLFRFPQFLRIRDYINHALFFNIHILLCTLLHLDEVKPVSEVTEPSNIRFHVSQRYQTDGQSVVHIDLDSWI